MDAKERVALLENAMMDVLQISPHYDDVLREVSSRIDVNGSVGKCDVAALAFWKRIRTDSWDEDFLSLPETRVREVTGPVVVAARKRNLLASAQRARELLRELPGFGTGSAMASAVLTAIRPADLAVYDRNANEGLKRVDLPLAEDAPRHYAEYMRRIQQCRAEAGTVRGQQWTGHEVDLSLYVLGKRPPNAS